MLYFLKVNGLIIAFYAMYSLFLKKETFFKSNRMFLLLGLISALILPLITISKTVWVEPIPYTVREIPAESFVTMVQALDEEPTAFEWQSVLLPLYLLIALLLLTKMGIEISSFYRRIKDKQREKRSDCTIIHNDTVEGPFSFLNYIVVNPQHFSQEELEQIMLHEQVHVKQKHSWDILFSKVMGAFFWINPVLKWYHKAIVQNLEYIADEEVNKTLSNQEAYYKTLLKIISPNNQLSTANLFYQSLIKKRIVMLQTHPSSKKKLWKYALMLPVLIAFTLMFQMEIKAQVKKSTASEVSFTTVTSSYSSIITKDATDQELKEMEKAFTDDTHRLMISNVKRNDQQEIIGIKLVFDFGKSYYRVYDTLSEKPIKDLRVFINSNESDDSSCGFEEMNTSILERLNLEKLVTDKNQTIILDSLQTGGKNVKIIMNGNVVSTDSFHLSGDEDISEIMKRVKAEVEKRMGEKENIGIVNLDSNSDKTPQTVIIKYDDVINFSERGNKNANRIITYGASSLENNLSEKGQKSSTTKDATIIVNGRVISHEELDNIDPSIIKNITVVKANDISIEGEAKKAQKIIKINTQDEVEITSPDGKMKYGEVDFTINKDNYGFIISKSSKAVDLEFYKSTLAKNNIDLKISGLKRNSLGEVTSLNIQLKQGSVKLQKNIKTDYPINTIYVGKRNGKIVIEEKN